MPATILQHSFPVLAGLAFAAVGIAYQAAQRRGVPPVRLLLFMAFFGAMLFAFRSGLPNAWSLPATMLAWAVAAGLGQYGCMKLVGVGMRVGPFSGLWCMLAMNFAPVIVLAAVSQGVIPSVAQRIAVAAALLCCVIASTTLEQPASATPGRTRYLAYGLLLLGVLILNSLLNMGLQRLAGQEAMTNQFLCAGYVAIGLGCLADMLFARPTRAELSRALLPGLCAAAGSICGMFAISAAVARTGPSAFLITSIVMLLIPMLVSVIVFREKATGRWTATLALGLIAVALANA